MAAQRRPRRRGADDVSTQSSLFAGLLGGEKHIAFDRAAAELRTGRPIVIETQDGATVFAALDGVTPNIYELFRGFGGGRLILSAERAKTLGLAVEHPVSLPLGRLDREEAQNVAVTPYLPAPADWEPGSAAASAAIELCKYALLLPAVVGLPLADDIALPPDLFRIRLDRLHVPDAPFDLEIVSEADVPLAGGIGTRFVVMRGGPAPRDQVAVIVGSPDLTKPVPVRVHSACLTGDMFGSLRCDCGDQLRNAIARLNAAGGGVLLYLDQEGRGIGIGNKMRAYSLQDDGFDTVDANSVLGFEPDERRYEYAAAMLAKLGFRRIILLTNNPAKIEALNRAGIEVVERQSLTGAPTPENLHYLYTKAQRSNHMLGDLLALADPMVQAGA
jgi:GTP cyclohydrolase II